MCDSKEGSYVSPQCQYFVVRKKRLCRMTVKPGKHYCGEHEPRPKCEDGQDDTRIPCPNDPKHTCYASKLDKHLSICNARQQAQPHYIIHNVNAPPPTEDFPRLPLAKIPVGSILQVIEKVNNIYDTHIKDNITTLSEQPIHSVVMEEFSKAGRAESSLRHLRQASSLLHMLESEQLVADKTCYIELGAGKGQLSYYAWWAWCQGSDSRVVLVDRASLRHKRDNKLRDVTTTAAASVHRLRADLAHLVLERVPAVHASDGVVGFAKHLCGVATDYALRCLLGGGGGAVRGAALASCCHHRCVRAAYPAQQLENLGIDGNDFNILLGIVSWATCGDGRSRDARRSENSVVIDNTREGHRQDNTDINNPTNHKQDSESEKLNIDAESFGTKNLNLSREQREQIGRRAKAILDWGRVLFLEERGFDAKLVYYVPTSVSLENVCIVAKKKQYVSENKL